MNTRVEAELERLRHISDHGRYKAQSQLKSTSVGDTHLFLIALVEDYGEDVKTYDMLLAMVRASE